ncbi:MAG TPA: hypothetical protein VG754_10995 [Verrucomicrobiae bacterium]|jgi:hypothetical protein|nr:hypothetical protein [Verrucomicrobiae bacterium]
MKEQLNAGKKQPLLKTTKSAAVESAQYPPPTALVELAELESKRRRVEEYAEVISKLRDDKGFTYRAIAEWLNKNGVPTDHNEVYRTHKEWCEGALKRYFERNRQPKVPNQD